jgi:autoinducer 2-degrading protein
MIVTIVYVWVKDEYIDQFRDACVENHQKSITEPGNLRFDVLQDAADSSKFVLYEAYESEEAALAHKETAHYLKWREIVSEWMARPRKGVRYTIIEPGNRSLW